MHMRKHNHEMLHVTRYTLHDKNGFTLIELIVVMAIISIMVAVNMPNYFESIDKKALHLAESQIINDVKTVQDYSYRLLKHNGTFPDGGYGIYFDKSSSNKYIVFADLNNDGIYDTPVEMYQEIELPQKTDLSEIFIVSSASTSNTISIVFKPPYGKVFFDGVFDLNEEIIITVKNNRNDTKKISIYGSGLVER